MQQSVAEDAMARRGERHGDFVPFDDAQAVSASQHAAAALWPVSDTLRQGLRNTAERPRDAGRWTLDAGRWTMDDGSSGYFTFTPTPPCNSFNVSHTSPHQMQHKSRRLSLESSSFSCYLLIL